MWLSAKTHGMRFPELSLGSHAGKKNMGGVRSGRVPCDRAEVRNLHELCGPGARHFHAGLAGGVEVTRPGLHTPASRSPPALSSLPQPHLAVGSNDYYISVYSVEKRVR